METEEILRTFQTG